MAMTRQLWSISSAAVELGKDRRTIADRLRDVPADGQINPRVKGWFLPTIMQALAGDAPAEGAPDYQAEKARLTQAQADAQEMKNAQARRELLARADVDAAAEGAFARVRAKLLGVPSKVAAEVAAEDDPIRCQAIVQAAVDEALSELAATDLADLCGDGDE